jgi:hypothetical protein
MGASTPRRCSGSCEPDHSKARTRQQHALLTVRHAKDPWCAMVAEEYEDAVSSTAGHHAAAASISWWEGARLRRFRCKARAAGWHAGQLRVRVGCMAVAEARCEAVRERAQPHVSREDCEEGLSVDVLAPVVDCYARVHVRAIRRIVDAALRVEDGGGRGGSRRHGSGALLPLRVAHSAQLPAMPCLTGNGLFGSFARSSATMTSTCAARRPPRIKTLGHLRWSGLLKAAALQRASRASYSRDSARRSTCSMHPWGVRTCHGAIN